MIPIDVSNKKGLIVGIANEHSIAWGCAQRLHEGGAKLAVTYLNEKAKRHVEPLAQSVNADIFLPLDVTHEPAMDALFDAVTAEWGKLDFVIHSIAFAPKEDLHGRVVDCSLDGFTQAMNISCHSFMRLAKRAEPLMADGGSLITMSYYGADKVVPHYGMMGPVKAALESCVEYMAAELGTQQIRVNTISAGAMPTRAGSGLQAFDQLLDASGKKSALHHLATPEDVGNLAAFLISDFSANITGCTHFVDSGYQMID